MLRYLKLSPSPNGQSLNLKNRAATASCLNDVVVFIYQLRCCIGQKRCRSTTSVSESVVTCQLDQVGKTVSIFPRFAPPFTDPFRDFRAGQLSSYSEILCINCDRCDANRNHSSNHFTDILEFSVPFLSFLTLSLSLSGFL